MPPAPDPVSGVRARVVVLVEGDSDAAVVRVLCAARGLVETAEGYVVRAMGGVTNIGHHLRMLDADQHVVGLCDAPEERFFVRALRRSGHPVESRDDLALVGEIEQVAGAR